MGTESGLRRRVKGLSEAEFRRRFGASVPVTINGDSQWRRGRRSHPARYGRAELAGTAGP